MSGGLGVTARVKISYQFALPPQNFELIRNFLVGNIWGRCVAFHLVAISFRNQKGEAGLCDPVPSLTFPFGQMSLGSPNLISFHNNIKFFSKATVTT